jgi:hypothetical protein
MAEDDPMYALINNGSINAIDIPESTRGNKIQYVGLHGVMVNKGTPMYCIALIFLAVIRNFTSQQRGGQLLGHNKIVVYLCQQIIAQHCLIPVGIPSFGGASTIQIDNATKRCKAVGIEIAQV